MSRTNGDGPTTATLRLDLPCHPLREGDGEGLINVADVRRVNEGYIAIVWTAAEDASAVADSLAEWGQVSRADALSTAGESRLLRLELAEGTPVTAAYEALVEHDVLLSGCTGDADGWEVRLTAPSHGALTAVYERWRALGVDTHVVSLGGEGVESQPTDGLTDSQREALVRAAETGYFSVPRQTTLGAMAEGLSVSDQAVSERIRRGTYRLVRDNVSDDGEDDESTRETAPSERGDE